MRVCATEEARERPVKLTERTCLVKTAKHAIRPRQSEVGHAPDLRLVSSASYTSFAFRPCFLASREMMRRLDEVSVLVRTPNSVANCSGVGGFFAAELVNWRTSAMTVNSPR